MRRFGGLSRFNGAGGKYPRRHPRLDQHVRRNYSGFNGAGGKYPRRPPSNVRITIRTAVASTEPGVSTPGDPMRTLIIARYSPASTEPGGSTPGDHQPSATSPPAGGQLQRSRG